MGRGGDPRPPGAREPGYAPGRQPPRRTRGVRRRPRRGRAPRRPARPLGARAARTGSRRPGGRMLGSVVVGVPLDGTLAGRLAAAAGFVEGDAVALAEGDRLIAASAGLEGDLPAEPSGDVQLGDEDLRYASARLLEGADVRLATLASDDTVRAAEGDTRRRAFFAALATLAVIALLAWTIAWILRQRRSPPADAMEPEDFGRRAGGTAGTRRSARRMRDAVALVLADLDDFKSINDRYGHGTGDVVLQRFADVMRENMRDFDLPVRFGGEEFAVLLPETGLEGGRQLALRLAAALARLRMPEIGGDRAPVTASFGVASFPEAGSAEELLSAADQALYRAKAEGKNRVASAAAESRRRG